MSAEFIQGVMMGQAMAPRPVVSPVIVPTPYHDPAPFVPPQSSGMMFFDDEELEQENKKLKKQLAEYRDKVRNLMASCAGKNALIDALGNALQDIDSDHSLLNDDSYRDISIKGRQEWLAAHPNYPA